MVHDARVYGDGEYGKRVPYVYAHGKLEDDLGTDLVNLYEGDYHLNNGLVAYTLDGKPVIFFLYKHPTFGHLTGIVCYTDDKEACAYGKRLVESKPKIF